MSKISVSSVYVPVPETETWNDIDIILMIIILKFNRFHVNDTANSYITFKEWC